ncbi:DNA integrity scanning diadenylate cyclase DisA [Sediminivirga luteola]|uniref:DNA integrity scanning diadenylate cyclase DisA n=1 Tax=Sediminivirga luteola TaxID=1774748 RepID=UPI0030DB9461
MRTTLLAGIAEGSLSAQQATEELMRQTLAAVAPGTELRDGLERVLRGGTGALIVLGTSSTVESISTGGFPIDVEFTGTRLRELAKMDGAVILDRRARTILKAGVQLHPAPSIPTRESGTRHRTAERVAKQTGFPVITVSQSMQIVQLYVHDRRHVLENTTKILAHANQALDTLERYKTRLDEVTDALTALEIAGRATAADVLQVAQRQEMVRRISAEISSYIIELGTDGRLLTLQHEELVGGFSTARTLLIRDYLGQLPRQHSVEGVKAILASLDSSELVDVAAVARALGIPATAETLDAAVSPRGYRFLQRVRRVPEAVMERVVEHFDDFQSLLRAGLEELRVIEGVGEYRARLISEGITRLAWHDAERF